MSMFPQPSGNDTSSTSSALLAESIAPSSEGPSGEKNAPVQWGRHSFPLIDSWLVLWRIFTLNRKATIGMCIVLFFVLVALFGPLFINTDPSALSNDVLVPPSAVHWLGTTQTGQDIFSQLVYGTRTSVFWGLGTGLMVTFISVIVGLVGGYLGSWVDDILTLLTNVSLVLPALPLAIVLAAYFPRGPLTISLVIVFTNWAWQARVLRSQTLSMRSREFVTAARASGESAWRIIFFEIFPNEIGLVVAGFVSTTIYVILTWAVLEFLGLGDGTTTEGQEPLADLSAELLQDET